jgi:hypothetical protein
MLFRTGQLYKLDMADEALKQAEIPHYLREETSSVLRLAMSAAPSMEPGTWWSILVPEDSSEEAGQILAELPFEITTTPDVWDCLPPGRNRQIWQVCLTIAAAVLIVFIIYQMITTILHTL